MPKPSEIHALHKRIGHNLHQARLAKGVTLELLARATGIGTRKLDQYEMGRSPVRLEVLLSIAAALNLRVEKFFAPA